MDAERLAGALLDWFCANARDLPWRRRTDPYAIWVSEIMLQQTQVKTVIPYWERWMRELPDVAALAAAEESRVLKLWEGLGYYRRARNLQAGARYIMDRLRGRFPSEPAEILMLPGVGRYTAGAIASIAYGLPEPILDGNVIRVLTRLGATSGDPKGKDVHARLWDQAEALVRAAHRSGRARGCSHLNQALMELGATVCLPRKPMCLVCPVRPQCRGYAGGSPEAYPETAARPAVTPRYHVVIIARHAGRYCVRRRDADAVNGGLWEFPNHEVPGPTAEAAEVAQALFGTAATRLAPWGEVRHAITRYRVTQRLYRLELPRLAVVPPGSEWRTLAELEPLPFSSAHRRVVGRLMKLGEEGRRKGEEG